MVGGVVDPVAVVVVASASEVVVAFPRVVVLAIVAVVVVSTGGFPPEEPHDAAAKSPTTQTATVARLQRPRCDVMASSLASIGALPMRLVMNLIRATIEACVILVVHRESLTT